LHGFSHFISFCLYLYKESERKTTADLYIVVEGSHTDFQPVPSALQPGAGSQIQKGLFSDPSPVHNKERTSASNHFISKMPSHEPGMYAKPLLLLHREITKIEPFMWAGGQAYTFPQYV
jgi:hypothetical protein